VSQRARYGAGKPRILTLSFLLLLTLPLVGCGQPSSVNIDASQGARAGATQVGARFGAAQRPPQPRCTIYVAPGGVSSAPGSSRGVPTTLASANTRVVPGSVVCLEPGTYPISSHLFLARSGSPSAPVYYRSDRGTALIQYTGVTSSGGLLQTSGHPGWHGTHYVVVQGLTLDGANRMAAGVVVARGAHHITIRNCVVRNMGAGGIWLNATDYVSALDNVIFHVGYNQGWSSGISLWYGGHHRVYGGRMARYDPYAGFHNYIVGNTVSGTYDNSVNHSDGNAIVIDGGGPTPATLIADNVFYENGGRGIIVFNSSGSVWVVNNTGYADGLDTRVAGGQAPEFEALGSSNLRWVNNLAYGRRGPEEGSSYTYMNNGSTVYWAYNVAYGGSTIGVSSSTTGDAHQYRYIDPRFSSLPQIPHGSAPWAQATPPWALRGAFAIPPGSALAHAGADPTTIEGMTGQLASDLRRSDGGF
jgi:Right handed beta helix region